MEDVSKGGRTVLFVSHNMAAIQQLTHKCLLLKAGEIAANGETADVVGRYFETAITSTGNVYTNKDFNNRIPCGREVEFEELELIGCQHKLIPSDAPINIRIKITGKENVSSFRFGITISQLDGVAVGNAFSHENLSIKKDESSEFTMQLKNHSGRRENIIADYPSEPEITRPASGISTLFWRFCTLRYCRPAGRPGRWAPGIPIGARFAFRRLWWSNGRQALPNNGGITLKSWPQL